MLSEVVTCNCVRNPGGARGIEPETLRRRGQLLSRPPTTGPKCLRAFQRECRARCRRPEAVPLGLPVTASHQTACACWFFVSGQGTRWLCCGTPARPQVAMVCSMSAGGGECLGSNGSSVDARSAVARTARVCLWPQCDTVTAAVLSRVCACCRGWSKAFHCRA